MQLYVALIYHPVEKPEHKEFNDMLSVILNSIPKSAEFIGGHVINANMGRRKKMHGKTMGPLVSIIKIKRNVITRIIIKK